jgi:hypothetical protein
MKSFERETPITPPDRRPPEEDLPQGPPGGAETERRDELAERSGVGSPSPAGRDRPDVLPDSEPPTLPM